MSILVLHQCLNAVREWTILLVIFLCHKTDMYDALFYFVKEKTGSFELYGHIVFQPKWPTKQSGKLQTSNTAPIDFGLYDENNQIKYLLQICNANTFMMEHWLAHCCGKKHAKVCTSSCIPLHP